MEYIGVINPFTNHLLTSWDILAGGHYMTPTQPIVLFITHRIHGTGIFAYIYHKNQPNVGKYSIHGSYG